MKLCVLDSVVYPSYLAVLDYVLAQVILLVEDNKGASNSTHRQTNPLPPSAY